MNPLTYTMPAWWPWMVAVWLILCIFLGLTFIRRDHPVFTRRIRMRLWLIRSGASAILLLLILNWSSERTRKTEEKPFIRILIDRSASMAAKDLPDGMSRYTNAMQAAHDLASIIPHASVTAFSSDLEAGTPGSTPDGDRSAVGQALFRTLENSRQQALGGVR
jgi:hypothetical protein